MTPGAQLIRAPRAVAAPCLATARPSPANDNPANDDWHPLEAA